MSRDIAATLAGAAWIVLAIAVLVLNLTACSPSEEDQATANEIKMAAADPQSTYVIHTPASGCPTGWKFAPHIFVERDGDLLDACIRPGTGGTVSIDVLMPGEGTSI